MLLLHQIATAMFVGFGPLFILCLLFDQTKQLFQKWLLYGIGTMFSMGVLAAMVSICMKMVAKVAGSLWAVKGLGMVLDMDFTNGITSQAMQTGGMGVVLTLLILMKPSMAAFFFQNTLGSFYGLLADRRCSIGWWIIQTARAGAAIIPTCGHFCTVSACVTNVYTRYVCLGLPGVASAATLTPLAGRALRAGKMDWR